MSKRLFEARVRTATRNRTDRIELEDQPQLDLVEEAANKMSQCYEFALGKWPETLKVVELDSTSKRIMRGGFRFDLRRSFLTVGYTSGRSETEQWYTPTWEWNRKNPIHRPPEAITNKDGPQSTAGTDAKEPKYKTCKCLCHKGLATDTHAGNYLMCSCRTGQPQESTDAKEPK